MLQQAAMVALLAIVFGPVASIASRAQETRTPSLTGSVGAAEAGSGFKLFEDDGPEIAPDRHTYRTLCVRMCDGYYFPVSFAVPHSALDRDARRCTARCGDDARLFFYANPGEPLEAARDFTGMRYDALPNAFRYRQQLVDGCQCRSKPGTADEAASARPGKDLTVQEGARTLRTERRDLEDGAQAPEPITQDGLARPAEISRAQPLPLRRRDRRADNGLLTWPAAPRLAP